MPEPPRYATMLEAPETVLRALQGDRPAPPTAVEAHTPVYRPALRPGVALLTLLDDGRSDDGETIRLRGDQFTIGRGEGDLVLAGDGQMSGKHAAIARRQDGERWTWELTDLSSTNGTFVRVGTGVLNEVAEFIVGRTRFGFRAASPPSAAARPVNAGTVAWKDVDASVLPTVTPQTPGAAKVPLIRAENWLGRDPACDISVPDDPYIDPRHAKLARDGKGRWSIVNNQSTNGVWLRLHRPMELAHNCQFLLGEQRFLFKVC